MGQRIIKGLLPNKEYVIRVRGKSGDMSTSWSQPLIFITNNISPPSTPNTPTVSSLVGAIQASWVGNTEASVKKYKVYYVDSTTRAGDANWAVGPSNFFADVSGTNIVISNLSPDETYYVKIVAENIYEQQSSASAEGSGSPNAQNSDGNTPTSSPGISVHEGPRWFAVNWAGVSNNDPVFYDVHLSVTPGFTHSAGTLVGTAGGTVAFIRTDGTGAELLYDTDYYIKLVARDQDGEGPAGAISGPHRLDPNATDDIAFGSIVAEHIDVLELEATKIYSPAQTGMRLEIGDPGFPLRHWNGTTNKFYLDSTGGVYISGRVDWGSGSRLTEDYIELREFGSNSIGFIQSNSNNFTTVSWAQTTTPGNLLLMWVVAHINAGSPPTITGPGGWDLLHSVTFGTDPIATRMSVFKLDGANHTTERTSETVTVSTHNGVTVEIAEYSGVVSSSPADLLSTNTGTGTALSVTTNPNVTIQADELFVTALVSAGLERQVPTPSGYTNIFGSNFFLNASYKVVNSTQIASASSTMTASGDWGASIVTLKASGETEPGTPLFDRARLYAKNTLNEYSANESELFYKTDTGRETPLQLPILRKSYMGQADTSTSYTSATFADMSPAFGFRFNKRYADTRILVRGLFSAVPGSGTSWGYRLKVIDSQGATHFYGDWLRTNSLGGSRPAPAGFTKVFSDLPVGEHQFKIQWRETASGAIQTFNDSDFCNVEVWEIGPYIYPGTLNQIPDIVMWYKADSITGKNDGDPLTQWNDSSGSALHLTQGTTSLQPTYHTNVQNGLPIVRFQDDIIEKTSVSRSSFIEVGNSITIFVAIKDDELDADTLLFWEPSGPSNRLAISPWNDSTIYVDTGDATTGGGRAAVPFPTGWLGNFHVVAIQRKANEFYFRVDGVERHRTSLGGTVDTGTATFKLGPFDGDIGEVVIYKRALDDEEVYAVENELKIKWGVV